MLKKINSIARDKFKRLWMWQEKIIVERASSCGIVFVRIDDY